MPTVASRDLARASSGVALSSVIVEALTRYPGREALVAGDPNVVPQPHVVEHTLPQGSPTPVASGG